MSKKLRFQVLCALSTLLFLFFILIIGMGCDRSGEIDELIFEAKQEAQRPVPSTSVEIPTEAASSREGFIETKLMEIQEAKLKVKKTPVPGMEATGGLKTAGESTKVVPSPQAEAPETPTLSGAEAAALAQQAVTLPVYEETVAEEGKPVAKPEAKPKPYPYKTYYWGQMSSNNVFAIRASSPDSGIWRSGKLYLAGFFVKVTVKNIWHYPTKVIPSNFQITTMDDKKFTATCSYTYSNDIHTPVFKGALLYPNEKYTAYLHFIFNKSTKIREAWAPDTSTVKYFRCLHGKPKIQYCY